MQFYCSKKKNQELLQFADAYVLILPFFYEKTQRRVHKGYVSMWWLFSHLARVSEEAGTRGPLPAVGL